MQKRCEARTCSTMAMAMMGRADRRARASRQDSTNSSAPPTNTCTKLKVRVRAIRWERWSERGGAAVQDGGDVPRTALERAPGVDGIGEEGESKKNNNVDHAHAVCDGRVEHVNHAEGLKHARGDVYEHQEGFDYAAQKLRVDGGQVAEKMGD